jgi:PAS domain S-box-containing protein
MIPAMSAPRHESSGGVLPPAVERLRALPWGLTAIVLACVYVWAARLGLSMTFAADQVTAVWPPTGIALAAVLLLGPSIAPAIYIGALAANLMTGAPAVVAAGIAAGNTLEALLGGWLAQRAGLDVALARLRDVLALVLGGALLSTLVSATVGVTSLCLGGVVPCAAFAELWSVWWVGDAVGALIVAPLILVWVSMTPRRWPLGRVLEALALLAGVVVVSLTVFVGAFNFWPGSYPLHYTVFPFVIAAAMRFGQRGASTVTFVASTLVIWSTVNGFGPFAVGTLDERLVMVQLFMAVVAVTGLLLAAAICERDTAERRRAEDYAELAASAQRLRLALEAGQMGVWSWNMETGDVVWSENLEAIHGLEPGGFGGTFEAFQALVHPDDRAHVTEAITRAVELRSEYDVEFRVVPPGGGVRWIAGRGQVFCDHRGRAKLMLGVGADVSQRKHLEDELRMRASELADVDRRKDEFLAMLAHELRNPLAPLANALHLLARDTGDRGRVIEMAERQIRHLVRLVDDLLDVSRITQGKIVLRKEPVQLADIVNRALETMREALDARGHNVTVSLPARPVVLDADGARIAQVLVNLLSNAAKFTAPGGSVWLTGEALEAEVLIRVRDTGIGLAPELVTRVFDIFVQGDASLARTRGGLGIGLTVVRRLVEMHGGRVEARSAGIGHGSEFLVYLPTVGGAVGR